jgi:hypothetical protein
VAQWSNPVATWFRNTLMRATPDRAIRRQMQSLWRAPSVTN